MNMNFQDYELILIAIAISFALLILIFMFKNKASLVCQIFSNGEFNEPTAKIVLQDDT